MKRRRFLNDLVVGLAVPALASAQSDYPNRPIRIVAAFSPGTGSDGIARALAEELTKQMGATVIVENREGAGGNIGHAFVAKSPADGYTLLMGTSIMAMAVHTVVPKPYDASRDFAPIVRISEAPMVALVGKNSKFRTWRDMVTYAKANPGKLNYITSGKGSSSHILMEVLMSEFGFTATDLPYKSSSQAIVDTASGQGDVFLANIPPARGLLDKGDLRMIATGSAQRLAEFPEVPTFAELAGKPDFRIVLWYGVLAPAGTPGAVIERLQRELTTAASKPSVRQRVESAGGALSLAGPQVLAEQIQVDNARFARIIGDLKIASGGR